MSPASAYGLSGGSIVGIQLAMNASMSPFFIDANVTGTESTVMVDLYPRSVRIWPSTAVVTLSAVQPMSESRTLRQDGGSADAAKALHAVTNDSTASPARPIDAHRSNTLRLQGCGVMRERFPAYLKMFFHIGNREWRRSSNLRQHTPS